MSLTAKFITVSN